MSGRLALTRNRIAWRDNFTCKDCGKRGDITRGGGLRVHHIIPRSEGGTDDFSNLTIICTKCHVARHRQEMRARPWLELRTKEQAYLDLARAIYDEKVGLANRAGNGF